MSKSKLFLVLLFSFIVVSGVVILGEFGGLGPNVGFHFGYYGELNKTRAVFEQVRNLRVRNVLLHKDLSLEDFSLVLSIDGKYDARFLFHSSPGKPCWKLLDEATRVEVLDGRTHRRIYSIPLAYKELQTAIPVKSGRDLFENWEKFVSWVEALDPEKTELFDARQPRKSSNVPLRVMIDGIEHPDNQRMCLFCQYGGHGSCDGFLARHDRRACLCTHSSRRGTPR